MERGREMSRGKGGREMLEASSEVENDVFDMLHWFGVWDHGGRNWRAKRSPGAFVA